MSERDWRHVNRIAATHEVVGYYASSEFGKRSEQFRCTISDADYKKVVARAKQRGHSNQTRGQALFDLLQTACGAQVTAAAHHATKKSPAQLDREVAEALAYIDKKGAKERAANPHIQVGVRVELPARSSYRAEGDTHGDVVKIRGNAASVRMDSGRMDWFQIGDLKVASPARTHHATARWDDGPDAWQTGYDFAKESGLHETRAEQREILRRVAPGVSKYDKGFVAAYQDMLGIPRAKTKDSHATKKRAGSRSSHATAADRGPRVLKVSRGKTLAGQRSITAEVQYPGEKASRVEFVGPSASIGGPGPVVMISRGHQTFVTDPSRFGNFGPEWVRRFFQDA